MRADADADADAAARELVQVVDRDDRVLGAAPRWRMRSEHLVHRVTYVFVHDGSGRLFVHLRTATKDVFPSHYDAAAGGVVRAGETYLESARREAEEELGVAGVELVDHGRIYYDDEHTRCWGAIFSCRYRGPFRLQAAEVVSGRFEPLAAILDGTIAPLTPDTLQALHALLAANDGRL